MKVVSDAEFQAARAARRSNFRLMKGNSSVVKERQKRGKDNVSRSNGRLNAGHLVEKRRDEARTSD